MMGIELAKIRTQLKLTQRKMPQAVGLHWNSLARMERGEMTISEPVAKLAQLIQATQKRR